MKSARHASPAHAALLAICISACGGAFGADGASASTITYTTKVPVGSRTIVDTRPASLCEDASLKGARCLPAADILGPHKRLANFSGLLWLLGTAGLKGDERVLIVGDQGRDKEFLAGLLFITGQLSLSVLTTPVSKLSKAHLSPGEVRSKTRETVYRAPMRAARIILRRELLALLRSPKPIVILDGRSESEYWGKTIRGMRGGHIAGAQHLAMTSLRPRAAKVPPIHIGPSTLAIAYGHNEYEGLIYLSRLVASGIDARVYLEGWTGWASEGSLPADNATYRDLRIRRKLPLPGNDDKGWFTASGVAILSALAFALFCAGIFVGLVVRKG